MKLLPVFTIIAASVALLGCSKDKFETTPSIEITEYNTREIFQGGQLEVIMNYFDKEGDLNQGRLTAVIRRQNIIPILDPNQDKADSLTYILPDFPPRDKGEITFRLGFNFLKESLAENDTLLIRFTVTDLKNNTSDSILTERIVVHLP